MKRTKPVLMSIATAVLVLAVTAGPAAALYDSSPPVSRGDSGESGAVQPRQTDYTSINATLGAPGSGVSSDRSGSDFASSINSIVGAQSVPEPATTVVQESGGFDWGDALIGASGALALMLISFATVRELRRHRHVTVESQA
jgi:hypothetical protein